MSDLIERQAAIDAVNKLTYPSDLMDVKRSLVNIPPAEPERKKGRWIKENLTGYLTPGGNGIWHCSECGHQEGPYPSAKLTYFCPDCGADMSGRR